MIPLTTECIDIILWINIICQMFGDTDEVNQVILFIFLSQFLHEDLHELPTFLTIKQLHLFDNLLEGH